MIIVMTMKMVVIMSLKKPSLSVSNVNLVASSLVCLKDPGYIVCFWVNYSNSLVSNFTH